MSKENVTLRVNEEVLQYLRNREINISDWFEHMVRSLMMDQELYWVIPKVGKRPKLEYSQNTRHKNSQHPEVNSLQGEGEAEI